jgi:uncharacterized protein (TIGR02145 family)
MSYITYNNKLITNSGKYLTQVITPLPAIKFGRLYNWYAVNTANFAPSGWHVPTLTELNSLISYLGGNSIAGGKLKEAGTSHWQSPNTGASNSSGFTAYPGGYRNPYTSDFSLITYDGYMWTATQYGAWTVEMLKMTYDWEQCVQGDLEKYVGLSVRLIKDDSINPGSLTDLDGNVYGTVTIGTQVWTDKNWACTKLNEGTNIPEVTDNTAWSNLVTLGRCNYNNDIANVFE